MLKHDDDELEKLAVEFANLVRQGMGDKSVWALKTALEASRVDGLSGILSLKIPGRLKDQPDAIFCLGSVDMVYRWGS